MAARSATTSQRVFGSAYGMAEDAGRPISIEVEREREVRIQWSDGSRTVIPCPVLRRNCPCAVCRSERETVIARSLPVVQSPAAQGQMATIASAELVGNYALRVRWVDGHDTGIYDYALLRALGEAEAPPPTSVTERIE